MAELKDMLYKVSITSTSGDMNVNVTGICFDSRKAKPGFLFIAIKGKLSDGHLFIGAAVSNGAVAVVAEKLPDELKGTVTYTTVKDSALALGFIAANFYGNPSSKLKLTGVTGTNGKTTVATILFKLFTSLGRKSGL